MGQAGEAIAAEFLRRSGAEIEARNVVLGGGELDLIVRFGGVRVAVEVKSITSDRSDSDHDPLEHFDEGKSRQVFLLASLAKCRRVDLIGVVFGPDGILVRWIPSVE